MHGQWTITPREYVREARRYQAEIGLLEWAAPMDWMCEPFIIAKTHASVQVHQRRTVRNYVGLMESAPDVPWIPVLQGWTIGDYHRMAGLIGYCWILFVRLAKLTHQHIKFPLYIMGAIMVYISWLTVHVCYGCFRHYAEWWSR